ncbi:GntR family transcriptional regulator [Devosia ginsengisoli]|uniref:GntR family transcriptional regulator n=1 Tax=Devosia ginsengisoli TaxID=400770 RepID=A0A5B8LWT6_9HYPH|nr:GntR family transcriptional regulator [Devosia ginsengisoli]MCR6671419.1 GntR family transcriptional regulator [Devosia ginsengisoli]QDZ11870.1 GntR family transcriptional regulator [Devosia ginsengisoli]
MAGIDLNRSSVSRYLQLASLFREKINSGQWKVDQQIPTVEDLASEYGVARATIRQALDQLGRDGLIERFRAKGTFVRGNSQPELWCSVGTDWSGLLQPTADARIEVLDDEADIVLSDVPYLIGELAPLYRRLRRRHWRNDTAFLLTEVYIDERLRKFLTAEDIASKTALRLVHDIPGLAIQDAQQTLIVGSADVETAAALDMQLNAPVANVYRRVVDADGIAVLIAKGTYQGHLVRFDIKLR